MPHAEWVRAFGPASLSNLGPGFDAIGLCIGGIGDSVEARLTEEPGVRIVHVEPESSIIPRDIRNTAARAASLVLEKAGARVGIEMRIRKHVPFGSGIGGSAASAVAGAWAANLLLDTPFSKEDLIGAVLDAEEMASGGRHGDNALPALLGGLILVSSSSPERYRRVPLVRPLPLAVIVPEVQILTKAAREMLPQQVNLRDAAHNAAELAFMIDAFHAGDWQTVGHCIMTDRLVEPVRATLVPPYEAVRRAALEAGALGCALTGSGPAMFAIVEDAAACPAVMSAMQSACHARGIGALGIVTEANDAGAAEAA
ncbi:MAG TPA: homoserine kinase [Rhodothermales bacterium]